ncbi:MAG TPA: helix-turn-helix transcriptional regulator [Kofleriaceae bacterium]|nr:helix-turn-helix transcriptional regulator [Kofleriaceae bacterium]
MKAHVDVDAAIAPSFVLDDELRPFRSGWHAHGRHQILYAARGALRLEIEGAQWLVPPQRAAWLAAGVAHRVSAYSPVSLRTAYLSRALDRHARGCRVFDLPPVGRELLAYGARWGPSTSPRDARARAYFAVLADLCREWAATPDRFSLPAAKTPLVERAMALTIEALGDQISLAFVARKAGASPRSLQRAFVAETGGSWRSFLTQARMLRAIELLAAPSARVTDVAIELGFDSFGAFTRAFKLLTGETPRDYAKRVSFREK